MIDGHLKMLIPPITGATTFRITTLSIPTLSIATQMTSSTMEKNQL